MHPILPDKSNESSGIKQNKADSTDGDNNSEDNKEVEVDLTKTEETNEDVSSLSGLNKFAANLSEFSTLELYNFTVASASFCN